jgi:CBS domain-containing protein
MGQETIRSILDRKGSKVWSISPKATVLEAIALMDEKRVGALMVVSEGTLEGVISERDYARKVILKGRLSHETLVEEIMSSPAITVSPEHSLGDCLRLVTHHRIRHLPVIDNGQLAGVVSIGDLAKAIISAQADAVNQLSNYIAGNYPA